MATVEYVYALYHFEAENPDEVSFRVGERVQVVEKDDAYGDGWFLGTNPRGETGLFPFSYTTYDEAAARKMAEGAAAPAQRGVMHSTLADIDQALTELHTGDAREDEEHDFAARSAAREELAKNAQKELAAHESDPFKSEPQRLGMGAPSFGITPLANIEVSDESEDEADAQDPCSSPSAAAAVPPPPSMPPPTPPSAQAPAPSAAPVPVAVPVPVPVPAPAPAPVPVDTAPKQEPEPAMPGGEPSLPGSFAIPPESPARSSERPGPFGLRKQTSMDKDLPRMPGAVEPVANDNEPEPVSSAQADIDKHRALELGVAPPPSALAASPITGTAPAFASVPFVAAQPQSAAAPAPVPSMQPGLEAREEKSVSAAPVTPASPSAFASTKTSPAPTIIGDPAQWSVEEVVKWAESKGYDASTIEKLTLHEISGDALLAMDINMLKEIDIIAFGRRFHLANGIKELQQASARANGGMAEPAPQPTPLQTVPQQPIEARAQSPVKMPWTPTTPLTAPPSGTWTETAPSASLRSGVTSVPAAATPPYLLQGVMLGAPLSAGSSSIGSYAPKSEPVQPAPLDRSPSAAGSAGMVSVASGAAPALAPPTSTASAPVPQPAPAQPAPTVQMAPENEAPTWGAQPPERDTVLESPAKSPADSQRLQPSGGSFSRRGSLLAPRKEPRSPHSDASKANISLPTSNANFQPAPAPAAAGTATGSALARLQPVDVEGWVRKRGERYGTWNSRYLVLKNGDLVVLRDPAADRIKSFVPMRGYKVIADENVAPGRYGFKIVHETERTHSFAVEDAAVCRSWMKALMKATIDRDLSRAYLLTEPVISSYNNPTISLEEAQRLQPRPPSPTSRMRLQREHGRENTGTLTHKDATVLMSLGR